MQTIYLMEGPDRVGKTNIGQHLSYKTGIPYFRMQSQHENWRKGAFKTALQFDQTYLTELLRQTGHSMVIDRAWPSEWVYSRVFGRDTDSKLLGELDKAWAAMGAWIIIPTRRSFEGVPGDEVVPKEKLEDIQKVYMEFFEWTTCNAISFDVDAPQIGCLLEKEYNLIQEAYDPRPRGGWKVRYHL